MKKIKPDEWYTPWEIVLGGHIDDHTKATSKNVKYQLLMRLIRSGRIPGKNLGTDNRPRYIVPGRTLIKFIESKS
jgi:hypothetical protein